jgi:hypothetical protein
MLFITLSSLLVLILAAIFLVESPMRLIIDGKNEQARKVLLKIRRINLVGSSPDLDNKINSLSHLLSQRHKQKADISFFRYFFTTKAFWNLFLLSLVAICTLYNWFLLEFEQSFLSGDIYWNNISSSVTTVLGNALGGLLLQVFIHKGD